MAVLVGTDITDGVCGGVGVAVRMAVKARDALAGDQRAAVVGGVELLLWERREEQPQAFKLLCIQDPLEKLLEIRERHELALGYVAQIGPRGQKDRRGKLGQQVLRKIEVEVEPREIALILLLDLVDLRLGKHHAARLVMRVGQREEAGRPDVLGLDLVGGHGRHLVPGHVFAELDTDAFLHRLAASHGHALGRTVGEVISRFKQVFVALGELGLLALRALDEGVEIFLSKCRRRKSARETNRKPRTQRPVEIGFHDMLLALVFVKRQTLGRR